MKKSGVSALLAVTLLIASCASNTAKNDSKQAIEKDIERLKVAKSWTAETEKYDDIPAAKWIKSFNDPVMLQLVNEGKSNNLNLKIVAGNMNKAWLLAEQSNATLKPIADLSFGKDISGGGKLPAGRNSPSQGNFNVGLQVSWERDLWGRLQAGVNAAAASAQAAKADYVYAQQSLSANIAKSYLRIIEAKQQTNIAQENKTILTETMRITQARYDNGLSTLQDVAINRANLAVVEDKLAALKGSQRDALRTLEVLLGRYPSAKADIPNMLPQIPPPPPVGVPSEILERRPDIVSAERKVAQTYNVMHQAKTAHLPKFSLTAAINGANSSLGRILNPSNLIWQLASNILTPLFDGGKRKIDVKIANVVQKQAVSNYVETALIAFSEVEISLDLGGILAKRETALNEVLTESNKAYKIAKLRYKEGEISLLDTLSIQQQTISAKSNLLSIHRLQLDQRINLYLTLGGGW